VRVEADPESLDGKPFCWRTSELDLGGRWGWFAVHPCLLHRHILPKMHDYESMTWADVKSGTGSHEGVEVDALLVEARERLNSMGIEDDALFSLRLSGKQRVWGIRRGLYLYVLWWDPEHEICPSLRDKTNKKNMKPRWTEPASKSGPCPFGVPPGPGESGPRGEMCLRCDAVPEEQ